MASGGAAIQLSDITGLPDALMTFRFTLLITLPSSIGTDGQVLSLRCQTVTFPGSEIESIPVGLAGFLVHFRGKKRFPGIMDAVFLETSDVQTWGLLKQWQEAVVGTESGNGLPKANTGGAGGYATGATLNVYDETGTDPVMSADIYNIWPSNVPNVTLDGERGQTFMVQCQFTYDYAEYSNVAYDSGQ